MKTVKQILIEARALIALPEHWSPASCALDVNGESVDDGFHELAVRWNPIGAVEKVTGSHYLSVDSGDASYFLDNLIDGDYGIAGFSSSHTHAEVLAVFDRAIEAAE